MSLEKIGHRTPSEYYPNGDEPDKDNVQGIPGLDKSFLFYQDKTRLPKASHGQGVYIYDTEDKDYLDGCSGAISANLGHNNQRIKQAAVAQLDKIAFTYRKQFENEPANKLAELLVQLSPPELNRVFFVNSGSEAVEAAMKIARQYWWTVNQKGKYLVISCRPSYHGATIGALATTDYAPLNIPFVSMTGTSPKVSAPFCYHCLLNKSYPECGIACAYELETTIHTYGADNIAAFIVEPIGGASTGAAVPPDEYFPLIERICHENNILLIVDDVMKHSTATPTGISLPILLPFQKGSPQDTPPLARLLPPTTWLGRFSNREDSCMGTPTREIPSQRRLPMKPCTPSWMKTSLNVPANTACICMSAFMNSKTAIRLSVTYVAAALNSFAIANTANPFPPTGMWRWKPPKSHDRMVC